MTTATTTRRRGEQTAFLRVRLSPQQKRELARRAKQAGRSLSAEVREALRLSA